MPATRALPRARSFRLLTVVLTVVAMLPTAADAETRHANLENGSFSEFDQTNAVGGVLENIGTRAYEGNRSAHATYAGGGSNAYSRGIWNVSWQDGDDVRYGAAYYLPAGFKSSMEGQVDLVRWDNWATDPTTTEKGGVVIYGSDKRARLVRIKQGVEQVALSPAFDLPEGRWFSVEVRQRLSSSSGLNEVYVDGNRISSTTTKNMYGHAVNRIRYGLVATAGSAQTKPLEMWFDRAVASSGTPRITSPAITSYDTDGTFSLSGTADSGSSVGLYDGAALRGEATTEAGGGWRVGLSGVPHGPHTYTARSTDGAGNQSPPSAPRTVIVDRRRPTAGTVGPAASATGVSPAANVYARFSEAIRRASINATTVTLKRKGTTSRLGATISYDASLRRAKLNPNVDLRRGATYIATVTTGVRDLAGNPLAATKRWSFTVRR
jgi:Bacterial Ig-like domain